MSSLSPLTVADYICQSLSANGIDTVFGIPGVHTVELYRALADSALRHVTPRNEQGAGFMADGYARASGKVAACFTITGPGLTNIATAMGQALADCVPMLVISSVNPTGRMGSGQGWLHELPDQRAFAAQVSVFSHTLLDPAELPQVLARAFATFHSTRPGPVHIEIPVNHFTTDMPEGCPAPARIPLPGRPSPDSARLADLTDLCRTAKQPVILAGGGAADAAALLQSLAERLDAPMVMTCNGRGILPDGHDLAVPCSPALPPVRRLIEEADLILALGTEIGPAEYDFYNSGAMQPKGRLVRVDIDAGRIMRGAKADLGLVSDTGLAVRALLDMLPADNAETGGKSRAAAAREAVSAVTSPMYLAGQKLLATIRDTLPEVIVAGDSAQPVYAAMMHFGTNRPRTWFCSATGFGTLGYAVSAATGAWLATGRPVVALVGDGGLQFNLGEIATAREIGCPLIIALWNNKGYFEIKNYMARRDIPTLGVDLFTPDFGLLATGFDCATEALVAPEQLSEALIAAAGRTRPTLLDIDEAGFLAAGEK
ncbi:5-guanidino-2-oxopentanoate decarboxylase [Xinfangfangia sp. D13-10-4-6]|uniref:5-guanidino-2-oxopentanoate decarboxylase n=1 Tax=Pseudogemmobacter hezensis TaxID=2737662 RepID=UPI00155471FB|nr:5-guanidino-2-oxopentanoate decarboxylase [Pseudogemmobacter hezensis]NPD17448.1 5-guanidino-2-oxopentanoate decarboxylase [Pseudogemmobacter hezensis]